jgi:hypothetical protein
VSGFVEGLRMNGATIESQIVGLFEAVCSRQFGNLGAYIKKSGEDIEQLSGKEGFVSAAIDAQSEDLCLLLYLSVPEAFLRETMPTIDLGDGCIVQYQEDWCMELANRFLGDLKNQLILQNCVMKMGLPKLLDSGLAGIELKDDYVVSNRMFEVDSHLLAQLHDLPVAFSLQVKLINKQLEFSEDDDEFDEDCFEIGELEHL